MKKFNSISFCLVLGPRSISFNAIIKSCLLPSQMVCDGNNKPFVPLSYFILNFCSSCLLFTFSLTYFLHLCIEFLFDFCSHFVTKQQLRRNQDVLKKLRHIIISDWSIQNVLLLIVTLNTPPSLWSNQFNGMVYNIDSQWQLYSRLIIYWIIHIHHIWFRSWPDLMSRITRKHTSQSEFFTCTYWMFFYVYPSTILTINTYKITNNNSVWKEKKVMKKS